MDRLEGMLVAVVKHPNVENEKDDILEDMVATMNVMETLLAVVRALQKKMAHAALVLDRIGEELAGYITDKNLILAHFRRNGKTIISQLYL